jgi:hypothetical protein
MPNVLVVYPIAEDYGRLIRGIPLGARRSVVRPECGTAGCADGVRAGCA